MYGRWLRNSFIYLLILVAIVAIVFTVLGKSGSSPVEQDLSQFVNEAKAGSVESVRVSGSNVEYKLNNDDVTYKTTLEPGDTVRQVLQDAGVAQDEQPKIEIKKRSQFGNIIGLLIQFIPVLLIVGILFFFLRQAQGSNNQALSFGKSRARMFSGSPPLLTFLDVAGVEEAKEELKEAVEVLKSPEKFAAL